MASTHALKKNYRCDRSLQQFYTGGPFAVGLAPGGDGEGGAEAEAFLACACGGEVRVVSAADASAIGEPVDGDSEAITAPALALSPDSRLIFAAGHSRLIRVWDLASRTCIRSWKGHDGPIMAMACQASGGLLATAGAEKKVCVWDVDGGFCTHFLRGHRPYRRCDDHYVPQRSKKSSVCFQEVKMALCECGTLKLKNVLLCLKSIFQQSLH